MFWYLAIGTLLVAVTLTVWPLLGGPARWKTTAGALVLLVPLAAAWMYRDVGTPAALDPAKRQPVTVAADGDMADLAEGLKKRLTESPDNVEGWVLLGRTYKSLQRFPEALDALETANRLAPDQPIVLVELVEARLFASGDPRITPELVALLERAVELEPSLQKGYWLLGIAAAQSGDEANAIHWWETLLQQVEPGSGVAQAVTAQIAEARSRLGLTAGGADSPAPEPRPAPAPPAAEPSEVPIAEPVAGPLAGSSAITDDSADAGTRFDIEITLAEAARGALSPLPPGAALFVIVRPAGAAAGPPLGVRRVNDPQFPLALTLTDADSMLPQMPISSSGAVEIQARLSMAGRATPAAGDWQSGSVLAASGEAFKLMLDQRVP